MKVRVGENSDPCRFKNRASFSGEAATHGKDRVLRQNLALDATECARRGTGENYAFFVHGEKEHGVCLIGIQRRHASAKKRRQDRRNGVPFEFSDSHGTSSAKPNLKLDILNAALQSGNIRLPITIMSPMKEQR
jgi:hypothetical protein